MTDHEPRISQRSLKAKIPTALTLARLILAFPIAMLVVMDADWAGVGAFFLFLFASLLDFFDGHFARKWDVITEFGRSMDPIADKALVATILMALAADGLLLGWSLAPALIIVMRDFLISGLREFAAGHHRTLHVTKLAKWKTAAELAALALLLVTSALGVTTAVAGEDRTSVSLAMVWFAGVGMLWITAMLSAWTGYVYARAVISARRPQS